MAAKRFEQQRQQQLLQQVPLRQFDDCSCYAAKAMTMPTTTTTTAIPVYDCPCGDTDTAGRIPPPPPPLLYPPLLYPLSSGGGAATCDVCGRALSAAFAGDESLCRCAHALWQSPYSRLPAFGDTGNHVTYVSTTATTGSCRRAASLRPSDAALDDVRHVTVTSDVGSCTLTSTRGRDEATSRRVVSD